MESLRAASARGVAHGHADAHPCGTARPPYRIECWRFPAKGGCLAGRRRGVLARALATVLAAAPGGTVAAKIYAPSAAALWRDGTQEELASAGLCVAMWAWALVSMHAGRGVALRQAATNTSSVGVRGSGASRTQCPRRDTNFACECLPGVHAPPIGAPAAAAACASRRVVLSLKRR